MSAAMPDMLAGIIPGSIADRRRHWYVFRALNLYRLTLAALLLGIFLFDDRLRFFGTAHPLLFFWTALGYMLLILGFIFSTLVRKPGLQAQVHLQALIDLLALCLMIYASGGPGSHLSILLAMAVAANGVLLPLYSTLLTAALAFFLLVLTWLYRSWEAFSLAAGDGRFTPDRLSYFFEYFKPSGEELGRIGMLGAAYFAAGVATYMLAERARRSEALARQRSQELLELAKLNEAIVQHLQSGIIVVDGFVRVRLINDMARELLNQHDPVLGLPLGDLSRPLNQRLASWLSTGTTSAKPFRQDEHLPDVTASFSHLSDNATSDTLIFLEDSEQLAQRLQQIKLAALGRLTAGIAHEIRNPLASISHAAQLLGESPTISAGDRRLSQIVYENAKRANTIIANVMDLSRRDRSKPEDIALGSWLGQFRQEFLRAQSEPQPQIELEVQPADLGVRFDVVQLQQVLWNLCINACVHGTTPGQPPRIRLVAGFDRQRARSYLDVIDFGPGIPEAEGRKIFEPFFTTKTQGTGLGLYICRELCEANRAQLQYLRPADGGSCFRITFVNVAKQEKKTPWTRALP